MATLQHRVLDGKYRLVRELQAGGMGAVWFAEHLSLHSPVAVKLIAKEVAETEEGLQRFLREARTAASIRSPHVVQILDYGVDTGTPYIVMELLDGESLAARLDRLGRLSAAKTELIIRQVSRAVGRAHDAGIVHRDLKPANIVIIDNDDEEVVKLLDFGIAKASPDAFTASLVSNTRTGAFLGTPSYVSPEQAEGIKTIDHRSDIWSMGVIAFECLVGDIPFKGDTFGSLVLSICSRPLPVPSQKADVPVAFDGWFARACARERALRFQSAREAAVELRAVLGGASSVEPGVAPVRASASRVEHRLPTAPTLRTPPPVEAEARVLDVGITSAATSAAVAERAAPTFRRSRVIAAGLVAAAVASALYGLRRESVRASSPPGPAAASAATAERAEPALVASPTLVPAVVTAIPASPSAPAAPSVAGGLTAPSDPKEASSAAPAATPTLAPGVRPKRSPRGKALELRARPSEPSVETPQDLRPAKHEGTALEAAPTAPADPTPPEAPRARRKVDLGI